MYKDLLIDAERFGKSIEYKKKSATNESLLGIMDAQIERAKTYKNLGNALACPFLISS
jgi:hypothetical protein